MSIEDQPYYHGLLPRNDIKAMLSRNGDFLVRITEPNPGQPRQNVLSVMFDESKEEAGIKHYIINYKDGKFTIDRYAFDSIPQLVDWHMNQKESITKAAHVVLKTPVTRESWELSHSDIETTKHLGAGAFGEVWLGTLRQKNGVKINVAIKLAKLEQLTKEQIKEIMGEARLMRMFDHPHVVKLYGVAAGREPLMLVMELADGGSLDGYLQKNHLPVEKRMEMCMGAAWGIEYLHSKVVIHRDIAARNCLYGEGRVKISDFGLTREGTVFEMDPHTRIPIRWLAPETLKTAMFTQKTDVFAFGVLCWEILMHGTEPYPGMTVAEVSVRVKEGYRMTLPAETPPDFQTLVLRHIWSDQNERWTMEQICKAMERMLNLPRPIVNRAKSSERRERDRDRDRDAGAVMTTREGRRRRRSSANRRV